VGRVCTGVRDVVGSIALAGAVAVLLAVAPAADAAGHVGLKIRTSAQRKLVASNHLKLAAHGNGRVAITTTARQGKGHGRLTHRRRTVLNGGKSLSLRLTDRGAGRAQSCLRTKVRVTARSGGKVVGKARRALKRDPKRCDGSQPRGVDLSAADRCDFISPPGSECMFPWPDNFFTRKDKSTDTGLRLNVNQASTPENNNGVHVDPSKLNGSDGFSPGAMIVLHVPGLDNPTAFQNTGAVPEGDMSQAFAKKQPIVLIDEKTGKRQLIWSELDSLASSPDNTDLIIRVGQNLKEGHSYAVALRNLKDANGNNIPAPTGFKLYRDRIPTGIPAVEKRRKEFKKTFKALKKAKISKKRLYLAWDFTVASERNISERMLSMRNDAFSQLGDNNLADGQVSGNAPQFNVTNVQDYPTPTGHGVENIREVTGTYQVPCYLDKPGCPSGSRFQLGADGLPQRTPGNMMTANFTCNIPRSAVEDDGGGGFKVAHAARPSMYGHGLFGDASEVHSANVRQLGNENNVITCATDFSGMAEEDVLPEALPALQDLSKFDALPDRLQQGFLNFMYLGRLLDNPSGFASDPAFRFDGQSALDPSHLFYYGNSQGGIAGGALTALDPDFTRSVLYVPAMNYSTLLTRSVDFGDYAAILYPSYPNEAERPLLLSMIQSLWDRGEPDGYANHMTDDPLPDTPAHKVLIEMAWGDHQVANVATQVEARTIGAPLRQPALDANRLQPGNVSPFFNIPTLGDLNGSAADGSGMFVWDIGPKRMEGPTLFGTDPAPLANTAPDDTFGIDPHDTVIRSSPVIRKQIADFIKPDGRITDPCGASPCYAAGWMGSP
jgi:hypothetical protein